MSMILTRQKLADPKIGNPITMNDRQKITEDIIYLARQDIEIAMKRTNELVLSMPQEAWKWSLHSYMYYVKGDLKSAILIIDHAIDMFLDNPSIHAEKAKYLLESNIFRSAINSYSDAIEIGNKINDLYLDDLCRFERAFCYCKIGDFSSAEADLDAVHEDVPFWFGRLYTKAELLEACRNRRLD